MDGPLALSRRSRCNYAGVFILFVGMSAGCFLYWRSLQSQPATDDNDQALAEMEQSRVYEQAVERNVGTFGLLMSRGADAVATLGEPRPLAITIMVLANLTAGGCFLVATRLPAGDRREKTASP